MIPKALPSVRGEADFPAVLRGFVQPATFQVIARLSRRGGFEAEAEELDGLFHDVGQLAAPVGFGLRLRIAGGHLHANLTRDDLNSFDERDVFGFLHEVHDVAFGVTAKAIVVAFSVIHMKRSGFFLMEGARRPHVAFALIGFPLVPHDFTARNLRHGGTCFQLVKETGWETHGC